MKHNNKKVDETTPEGTAVYLVESDGSVTKTRTRSPVWPLGDGELVVSVEGKTGGWAIDRMTVVPEGDLPLEVRPEVAWFAEQMELQLRANDHKGGWQGHESGELFDRLHEETDELAECLGDNEYTEDTVKEAADVANFAMMLADNARCGRD